MGLQPRIIFLLVLAVDIADQRNGADDICTLRSTWKEAYRCCRSRSLVLPAPSNMTDVSRLFHQARNLNVSSVWLLHIRSVRRDWMWIDSDIADPGEIDGTRPGFCGAYNQSTRLVEARKCDDKSVVGAICEIKDCETCEAIRVFSVVCIWHNNTCYIYFCNKHNWYQAKKNCLRDGWTMATVKRPELRAVLASRQWACDIFWVGVRKDDWLYPANNEFVSDVYNIWPHEGPLGFGRCAVVNASGQVPLAHPVSCAERHSALCEDDYAGHKRRIDKQKVPYFLECILMGLALLVMIVVAIIVALIYRHKRRKLKHREDKESVPPPRDIENGGASETDPLRDDKSDSERDVSVEAVDVSPGPIRQLGPLDLQSELRMNEDEIENISLGEDITDSDGQSSVISEQLVYVYAEPTKLVGPWQSQVAKHYKKFNNHIHLCPFGPYYRQKKLKSLYIPPSCSVQHADGRESDVKDNHSIFRNPGSETSTILQGLPGSGKTTIVNWCLTTWADLVLSKRNTAPPGGDKSDFHYDLIVCAFLRHVKPGATLSQVIKDQIWCDPDCYPEIDKFIHENPSRILFILDGLDEYRPETSPDITNVIQGRMLPNMSKIVTSRHTKSNSPSDELVRNYSKRVQINGFDDSGVLEYMYKYKGLPDQLPESMSSEDINKKQFADELYEKIKAKNMLSLCHMPLHLCFFCQVAEAGGVISTSKTKLYLRITKYTIDLNISKTTSPSDFSLDNIHVYHDDLVQCGTGALNLLRGEYDRFTFTKETESDCSMSFIEKGIKFGLIIPVQPEHLGDTKYFTFSHLSLQEFLASYAIVHDQNQRQLFISYLTDIFRLHDCRNITSFCCGLSEQCGNELLSHAVELVRNSKDNPTAHQCPYFNRKAWYSGKVDWEAEINPSPDITQFLAQSVAQYIDKKKCDITLPEKITLDLSHPDTDAILTIIKYNKSQSAVKYVTMENGDLSKDIWETTASVILLHEVKQLSLDLKYMEDTAALAASINQMTNLTYLTLVIQSLTETDSERILAAIPQTISLVRLCMRYFPPSPRGADLLSDLMGAWSRLVTLHVADTDMSLLGPRVTSLITSHHLAVLEIDNTHVTQEQLTSLCTALPGQCPQLLRLVMDGNDISGMEDRMSEAVSNLHHLSWLSISDSDITSEGLWRILQHLPDTLRLLDICDNGFTHFSRLSECFYFIQHLRFLLCLRTAVPAEVMRQMITDCKHKLPDLILMYDDESYKAGEQALDVFMVEHVEELKHREVAQTDGYET